MTDSSTKIESPIFVTGCAGFIGFHLSSRLLANGMSVVGLDNLDSYYDVSLKDARVEILRKQSNFRFHRQDLVDDSALDRLFGDINFAAVIHLAAQPGVRYSLINPRAYLNSNITAFFNVLEACRNHQIPHLIYASSSSVYGLNTKMPFSVHDNVDHPISFYAASKKTDELLAHTYSHLFNIPTTGLRFFTAYGPWYRPDMALFKFSRAIYLGEPVTLYNHGNMRRDFTYIDDIVDGIMGVLKQPPEPNTEWSGQHPDAGSSPSPYRVYNIGAGQPVELMHFLSLIEKGIGKKAVVNLAPIQPGELQSSCADISDLERDTGYHPKVSVEEGIGRFLDWFLDYYGSGHPIPKSD